MSLRLMQSLDPAVEFSSGSFSNPVTPDAVLLHEEGFFIVTSTVQTWLLAQGYRYKSISVEAIDPPDINWQIGLDGEPSVDQISVPDLSPDQSAAINAHAVMANDGSVAPGNIDSALIVSAQQYDAATDALIGPVSFSFDTRIVVPFETLSAGGKSAHLATRRLRRPENRQPIIADGANSSGAVYRYGRGLTRVQRTLAWKVSGSVLADIRTVLNAGSQGRRRLIAWTDAESITRQVRLAGDLYHRQIGGDRYLVEIPVIEEVS